MTRTRPGTLVALAVVGAVAGFLLQLAIVASGGARYQPMLSLPLALVFISVIVIALAVPIWRSTRRRTERRIDPFHATRVVLLAKACSLAGALLGGALFGVIVFVWTRALTGVGSLLMTLAALGGAVVLLAAGLVAEHLCTVPPDDDDDEKDGRGGPGRPTPA